MANRERGELSIQGKDGKAYTFALGLNAQCEIEDQLSTPDKPVRYQDFLKTIDSSKKVRLLFWAASHRHHPDLTQAEVGAIVDQGFVGIGEIMSAVNQLIEAGMPTEADVKESGLSDRPPKARINGRGIGVASTSKPGALA